jgi:valyl-tRNA synthetase
LERITIFDKQTWKVINPPRVTKDDLRLEDRWLLSRLATVTKNGAALQQYQYADAARVLYDFAWDHYCSFYVEMAKPRLQDPQSRAVTQLLIHGLDVLLRLLHHNAVYHGKRFGNN